MDINININLDRWCIMIGIYVLGVEGSWRLEKWLPSFPSPLQTAAAAASALYRPEKTQMIM